MNKTITKLSTILGIIVIVFAAYRFIDTEYLRVSAYQLAEAKTKADIELIVARIKLKQAQREYTELMQRKRKDMPFPGDIVRLISVEQEIKEHISNISELEKIK